MRKRNWQMEVETNRALLTRVLAMFFALAGLSPCDSSLPRPLRIFLLRILRPGRVRRMPASVRVDDCSRRICALHTG